MAKQPTTSSTEAFSLLTDFDIHLFKSGKHYKLYEKLGAHPVTNQGKEGTYFAVWAPNARSAENIENAKDTEGVEVVFGDLSSGYIADDGFFLNTTVKKNIWGIISGKFWGLKPNSQEKNIQVFMENKFNLVKLLYFPFTKEAHLFNFKMG